MNHTRPLAHHCTARLVDDRVIAPGVSERRILARCVSSIGAEFGLVAFHFPDTHGHITTTDPFEEAMEMCRRIQISASRCLELPVPFQHARVRPILTQRHLRNSILYTAGNSQHHGSILDAVLDGSNVPDLLGLRTTAAFTIARLRELLPRLARKELLEPLGVTALVSGTNPAHLPDATAAAVAACTWLGGERSIVEARRAGVHLGRSRGWPTRQMAELYSLSPRQVRQLLTRPPDPRLVRAIDLQIGLRELLGMRPRIEPVETPRTRPYRPVETR